MRLFTISELWGPCTCEKEIAPRVVCNKESWCIVLSDEENSTLPKQIGPEAIRFIFTSGMGIAMCKKHLKELKI